jgi:fructokinase
MMDTQAGSIVVFGEALVDDFGSHQVLGGAPFNVARHLAAFRAAPLLVSRVGNDANGAAIRADMARFSMWEGALQIDPCMPTGRVVVECDGEGHRFVIEPDQAYDYIDGSAAQEVLRPFRSTTIYFGTLSQRAPASRQALYGLLGASTARRYLDLNVREGQVSARGVFESLHEADIVKVNEDELHDLFHLYHHVRLSSADMHDPALRAACAALIRVFSLALLIVTLGPRGAVCFDAHGNMTSALNDTPLPDLVDTVGAGDGFSAIFLLGNALGWPLGSTLARANSFAAGICRIAGAVPTDNTFYDGWIDSWLTD